MNIRQMLGLGALFGAPVAAYAGYPALVWAAAILRSRPHLTNQNHKPVVAVVIAAHNEAGLIEAKVRQTLDLDYPSDRLACVVVCDGCSDGTADAARAASDQRLNVVELPRQRGKLAAIRAALPHARGEVIAFTDANVVIERDALRHLVAPLADPCVAVVSGAKHVGDGPEAIYWRYERWIRGLESASGSIAGADGALYAVRATGVDASACPGAADDLLISLRAIRAGGRIVFAPRARATEAPSQGVSQSFTARTRTTSGALFALESLPGLFCARRGDLWWKLAGHKLLRIATPLVMAAGLALLASSLSPARRRVWLSSLVLVAALAALPGSGRLVAGTRYALLANLAAIVGLTRFVTRRPIDAWSPARGEGDAMGAIQQPLN